VSCLLQILGSSQSYGARRFYDLLCDCIVDPEGTRPDPGGGWGQPPVLLLVYLRISY
jgi:hypothetical protein